MITLTKQQVIDFINSQPDERPVKMDRCYKVGINDCGCLLIHLHRNSFPNFTGDISASSTTASKWDNSATGILVKEGITHFLLGAIATTYKDLKQQALTW